MQNKEKCQLFLFLTAQNKCISEGKFMTEGFFQHENDDNIMYK